ncbi:hypothetical protein NKG94_06955 [Micromonospora sp. M12]
MAALTAEGALTGLVAGVVGVAGALTLGYALPAILRAAGHPVSSPGLPWVRRSRWWSAPSW